MLTLFQKNKMMFKMYIFQKTASLLNFSCTLNLLLLFKGDSFFTKNMTNLLLFGCSPAESQTPSKVLLQAHFPLINYKCDSRLYNYVLSSQRVKHSQTESLSAEHGPFSSKQDILPKQPLWRSAILQ